MQQKLVQIFFYNKKLELLENNIGKEPQKPHPKLKNMYIIYLMRIFALPVIHCKW